MRYNDKHPVLALPATVKPGLLIWVILRKYD